MTWLESLGCEEQDLVSCEGYFDRVIGEKEYEIEWVKAKDIKERPIVNEAWSRDISESPERGVIVVINNDLILDGNHRINYLQSVDYQGYVPVIGLWFEY